jgi:Fe-S-cluster containining protein
MKRCKGHCCRAFFLPCSPEELEAHYHRWLEYRSAIRCLTSLTMDSKRVHMPELNVIQDIHLIYPMVRYLGAFKRPPYREVVSTGDSVLKHYYTCKHFDPKTSNCTIYAIRPVMCRDYPYGRGCNYADCTWSGHKQLPVKKQAEKSILSLDGEIAEKEYVKETK